MQKPQNLKDARTRFGLSQLDLAELSGLRATTFSNIEKGRHVPTPSTRRRIERIVGPVDWVSTFAGSGRQHIVTALREFININGPGDFRKRIYFARQVLNLLNDSKLYKNDNEHRK